MQPRQKSTLSFRILSTAKDTLGPRLGELTLARDKQTIHMPTPGLLISAPRGVIPHLSRDNLHLTDAIKWINVPLETFLERNPPLPTLIPLHDLLGSLPEKHILSMSLRDPSDMRHVHPNGNDHIAVLTARGAKQVSPSTYKSYLSSCDADIYFAQTDTCIGKAPHSQKRLAKSIERSTSWLSQILAPSFRPNNLFVHLSGGASVPARAAFTRGLREPLEEKEKLELKDLDTLDDGVSGYSFDLAPLRDSIPLTNPDLENELVLLLHSSLSSLPSTKPRLANSAIRPHEVLKLIQDVGIDVFDAAWAFDAAQWGVALDFSFPVDRGQTQGQKTKGIGHNLYDPRYAMDFGKISDHFLDGLSAKERGAVDGTPVCPCIACSPIFTGDPLDHNPVLSARFPSLSAPHSEATLAPPVSRAYLHHLLHTHEMSAHAILVTHNLAVAEAFFEGVRRVLSANNSELFQSEVSAFGKVFGDDTWLVMDDGRALWAKVDRERGKGRLTREKEKQPVRLNARLLYTDKRL